MPENKSCENCGRECEDQLKNGACSKWVYVNEKSAATRGENYHKGPEQNWRDRFDEFLRSSFTPCLSANCAGCGNRHHGICTTNEMIRCARTQGEIENFISAEIAAAEKRGAEKERERAKPLAEAVRAITDYCWGIGNIRLLLKTIVKLTKALKTYEEGCK